MTTLHPTPGYVLVELEEYYGSISVPEGKYNHHTSGICLQTTETDWIGKRVFWEEFQASEVIEHEGKKYAFIKLEHIRGYEAIQKAD